LVEEAVLRSGCPNPPFVLPNTSKDWECFYTVP